MGYTGPSKELLMPNQAALGEEDFFPKLIVANAKRGIARLSQADLSPTRPEREINNIIEALAPHAFMDEAKQKEILSGETGEKIAAFAKVAATNLVNAAVIDPDLNELHLASMAVVEKLIGQKELFDLAGFTPTLKKALEALEKDISKPNRKYPRTVLQAVGYLFGKEEKIGE